MTTPRDGQTARAREIQAAIGMILLRDWDPIGVRQESAASDEYESYVGGIYRLLASGAGPEQVAEHLAAIAVSRMGLSEPPADRLLSVAQKLCALDVGIERK